MSEMTSIFTIERRNDFFKDFTKFFEDLQTSVVIISGKTYKMYLYLDHCIRYWPYRCGATGIDDYLKGIDVDLTASKENKDLLFALELFINLLYWAPKQFCIDNSNFEFDNLFNKNDVEFESKRLIQNATHILEQCCNMAIREEDDDPFPKYYITRRNTHVDSAVIAVPELKDVLLGYLDIRNKDDAQYKESTLTALYGFMEPHRDEYKKYFCSSVSEEFFASMNTFGIRHNTKSQIRLQNQKKISVYDQLFFLAVYTLQTFEVKQYIDELKRLREKS